MGSPATGSVPVRLELAFAPLHKFALGLACGVVSGVGLFLVTAIALVQGGQSNFEVLDYIGQYFIGYAVSWPGALIGLLWGFGSGFILGWSFALLRNFIFWAWLTIIRSRAEMEQYDDFLDHL